MSLVYAYARRRSTDRQAAYVLALVWCGWFAVDQLHHELVEALSLPKSEARAGVSLRALLNIERAVYLAWPAGILAWVCWTFRRSNPWPIVLAWLAASVLPIVVHPALRGDAWFRYAGAIHLAALAGELAAFVSWARLREPPRPWHAVAIVAIPMCSFPAIPFFASGEARAGYLLWVLRGLVALHLGCIAVLGGDLWTQLSRGSSRS